MFASNIILALFNCLALNKVDFSAQYRLKFLLRIDKVKQCVPCIWREGHEHVHVAVGSEIIAQD